MAACKVCSLPLFLDLESDDFDDSAEAPRDSASLTVPDDLQLSCGCHFHWQCFLDLSSQVAVSLSCPSCGTRLVSTPAGPSATNPLLLDHDQRPQIITSYISEGGIQEDLDILPLITEEAYLEANPAARPARAYLTMCAEGDVSGIIEMLQSLQSEGDGVDDSLSPADILRYQDPLGGMKSALHVAVENQQQEVVWLLLWLASSLRSDDFPEIAISTAHSLGAGRETVDTGFDIRTLRDERGETAGDEAMRMQGIWVPLIEAGIFST